MNTPASAPRTTRLRRSGSHPYFLALGILLTALTGFAQTPPGGRPSDQLLGQVINIGMQLGTAEQSAWHEYYNRSDLRELTTAALKLARDTGALLPPAAAPDLAALDGLLRNLSSTACREVYRQLLVIRTNMLGKMNSQNVTVGDAPGTLNLARMSELGYWLGWVAAGAQYYGDRPPKADMIAFMQRVQADIRNRAEFINQQLGRVWIDPAAIEEILRLVNQGASGSQIRAATHKVFYQTYQSLLTAGTRGIQAATATAAAGTALPLQPPASGTGLNLTGTWTLSLGEDDRIVILGVGAPVLTLTQKGDVLTGIIRDSGSGMATPQGTRPSMVNLDGAQFKGTISGNMISGSIVDEGLERTISGKVLQNGPRLRMEGEYVPPGRPNERIKWSADRN